MALALALAAGGWVWHAKAPITVEITALANVYPSQALTQLNATGYVVAQRKASVASKATGRLEWLGVLEGSRVKQGELIARLENRDAGAARDQALANVQLAEANIQQGQAELLDAEQAFKRSEDLVAKKYISQSAHDSAVARHNKARAALAGLQASLSVAQANLRASGVSFDQTLIRAPFDGVVLTKNANVGDTITPFSSALDTKGAVVTIADMNTLEVEADVAESSLSRIHVGQPCEIQLDAIPGERFPGVVNRTVPTVDRAKATVLVKIKFIQRDPRVLPDMSAKIAFLERAVSEAERKPVIAVPAGAIVRAEGTSALYVVRDGHAVRVPVATGIRVGDAIEVRSNEVKLGAGDRVVLKPLDKMYDGAAVKVEQK